MNDKVIAQHTNAVNLARRYSVQNENDLLQVSQYLCIEISQYCWLTTIW